MSARTAFESLAREAMERQDYWLAESLLREYLTAGPRCVPFLEMLGRVYEEKGDVMAAVAEYGKAVEVLLEDPDTDHPNRAGELFGRIRSIAPGSPVAFRFAAMFDTVTGQVLQTIPQPAAAKPESEHPQPEPSAELLADHAAAGAMPWEQMESPPTKTVPAPEAQIPSTEGSIERMAPGAPLAMAESVTESVEQDTAPDQTTTQAGDSSTVLELQQSSEPSSSVSTTTEPIQATAQNEASTIAEDPKPAIEVQSQGSSHPITEKPKSPAPMPWDKIEEAAPEPSPAADSQTSTVVEVAPTLSVEADLPAPPVAELSESMIEMPVEGNRHAMEERLANLAFMPTAQADVAIPQSSTVGDRDGSAGDDVVFALSGEAELPPPSVLEAPTPTIEVLRTASAHPITAAPISPASMPWDQIEETPAPVLPEAEVQSDAGMVEAPQGQEVSPTDHAREAKTAADSPTSTTSSFTSSSGLSWEDILAAVAAMQASPDLPQTHSTAESEDVVPLVVHEETPTSFMPPADSSETAWLSLAPPPSDSLAGLVSDSPPLSAPMPWEQIEVEDVAIPRQDPEPEFGPVSTDVVDSAQDATVVLPAEEDEPASMSAIVPLADETVVDSAIQIETRSTPEFHILSPDTPIELHEQPIPIHIPVEAIDSVEEPTLAMVFEPESPVKSTIYIHVERPLRLAGSEAMAVSDPEQPRPVSTEPLTESVGLPPLDMPTPPLEPAAVRDPQAPLAESTDVIPSNPLSLVEQAVAQMAVQQSAVPTIEDTVAEAADPSPMPAFIVDQTVIQSAPASEIVRSEEDVAPASDPETARLPAQDHASMSEAVVCNADVPPLSEVAVPEVEIPVVPVILSPEVVLTPPPAAHDGGRSVESDLTSIDTADSAPAVHIAPEAEVLDVPVDPAAVEVQTTAPVAAAAPEATAEGGLRILWDDSSSKPIPSASAGNMLTRWLSKPKDVAPAEPSQSTTMPHEPVSPVAPSMDERSEVTVLVTDRPVDQSDESTPLHVEQPASRQKPSKTAAGQAWRHIGRAASSLIGAGVSTTRSLVVLLVALVGGALTIVAGTVGAIALTWLVLEEQPIHPIER